MTGPVLNYERVRPAPRPRVGTIALICVLALALLAFLGKGIAGLLVAHLWSLFNAGGPLDADEVNLSNILIAVGDYTLPLLPTVACISLIIWMYDAHKKLPAFSDRRLRFSHGEAVWGWVRPWSFLIRPFEVMKEIYAVSRGVPSGTFTPVVGCWWGFWLAANFFTLTGYLALSSARAREAETYVAYGIWSALGASLYAISGVCLMAAVYRIDRAQARRRDLVQQYGRPVMSFSPCLCWDHNL